MKVVILGHGVEGKSSERYWHNLGHEITIRDKRDGPNYLENLSEYDVIVRSPGVKPSDILKANPGLDRSNITSAINEFLAECPAKVIGVTGTKGKGTTSTLITRILEAAGHKAWLGGNIGTPPLDFLAEVQPEDWVVLELSSFQLMDSRYSPHIGVMLMIATDHQDWHPNMDEYLTAKQNIFAHQQPGDIAIYNCCNVMSLQSGLGAPADQVPYNCPGGSWVDGDTIKMIDTPICSVSDVALPGPHNLDNVCAAIAATWPVVQQAAPIKQAITGFKGLEHRLERVAEINGVTYINDSYSSSSGPTIAAIKAFTQPKVLIIGGYDKKLNYEGLAEEIKGGNVRHVIVIGAIAPQLSATLDKVGYKNYSLGVSDMTAIVEAAAEAAQTGDVVVLSPGTSSFDMFKNFKQRGEHFKAAVQALANK